MLLLPVMVIAGTAWLGFRSADVLAEEQTALPTTCVACHTDAARLAALTAPDPPAEEQGEG
jgi:hypothetical protein